MIVAYLCVYKSKKNYNPQYIHKSNIKIYKDIYIYVFVCVCVCVCVCVRVCVCVCVVFTTEAFLEVTN